MTHKIALVELGNAHDECLYSQIQFLKSRPDTQLTLICSPAIQARANYLDQLDQVFVIDVRAGAKQWLDLWRLRSYISQQDFNKVILNTAQGSVAKKLCILPFNKKIEFIGILHNLRKLRGSFSQTIIFRKIKKLFVLNELLLRKAKADGNSALHFASTYLVYFPPCQAPMVEKPNNEIWICIPGQVELKRRDYDGLFAALASCELPTHIKFILLGKSAHKQGDGSYVKQRIQALRLEQQFLLWDDFVDPDTFCAYMRASDYVLPLIHPHHQSSNLYAYQITGAYNMAFGYGKIILADNHAADDPDLGNNARFYTLDQLGDMLCRLEKPDYSTLYQEEKWRFEYQAEQYWQLLNLP